MKSLVIALSALFAVSAMAADAAKAPAAPAAAVAAVAAPAKEVAKTAPAKKAKRKADPAVLKIQQDLIAKGAKIKADGVMGPATKAAQKKFATPAPVVAPAAPAPAKK
jgi:peptidoglycan hydrolase-like protein with peptidoglycan-binding domain